METGEDMTKREAKEREFSLRVMEKEDTDRIVGWRNQDFVRRCFIYQKDFTREGHENWIRTMIDTGLAVQFIICIGIGQQWSGAANANQFALAFLQADGQWNLNNDQTRRDDAEYLRTVYTQLRSKTSEQDATFTTDKSHMSIIGYGQGGAAACEIAAEYPAIFCNLTMVDAAPAPAAVLNEVGERLSFPFPADSFNGQQELQLKNNKIPVPVWSIGASGDSAAVDYWKGVNQEAAEVRVTAEAAAPASIWADFMSRNGRFLGYAGGTLYPQRFRFII